MGLSGKPGHPLAPCPELTCWANTNCSAMSTGLALSPQHHYWVEPRLSCPCRPGSPGCSSAAAHKYTDMAPASRQPEPRWEGWNEQPTIMPASNAQRPVRVHMSGSPGRAMSVWLGLCYLVHANHAQPKRGCRIQLVRLPSSLKAGWGSNAEPLWGSTCPPKPGWHRPSRHALIPSVRHAMSASPYDRTRPV